MQSNRNDLTKSLLVISVVSLHERSVFVTSGFGLFFKDYSRVLSTLSQTFDSNAKRTPS